MIEEVEGKKDEPEEQKNKNKENIVDEKQTVIV